jgi:cell wall-associated NlpC family hydrolase
MAPRPAVSGLAAGVAAAGGILLWTGVANVSVADGLRDLLQGRPPGTTGTPTGPALHEIRTALDSGAGAAIGGAVAEGARAGAEHLDPGAGGPALARFVSIVRAQLGKPYQWGAAGPDRFDCSGLISYALIGAGLDTRRRVTGEFLVWNGAVTIGRDRCALGDLVCWTGHMGMAISRDRMIHAPSAGRPVQEGNIWNHPPPTIRRIRGAD